MQQISSERLNKSDLQQQPKIDVQTHKPKRRKRKAALIKEKIISDWDRLAKIYISNTAKLNKSHLKEVIKINQQFKKNNNIKIQLQFQTKIKQEIAKRDDKIVTAKIIRPRTGINRQQLVQDRKSFSKKYLQECRNTFSPQLISQQQNNYLKIARQRNNINLYTPQLSFINLKKQKRQNNYYQSKSFKSNIQSAQFRNSFTSVSNNRRLLKIKVSQLSSNDKQLQAKQQVQHYGNIKKIFCFKSQDYYIRRILIRNGWKQCNIQSKAYTLKWSYNDHPTNYQELKNNIYRYHQIVNTNKYYNHIKNNKMVTKIGLYKIYCNLMQANQKPCQFMPRTYNLKQQFSLLEQDYLQTSIMIIIKKHYQYFKQVLNSAYLQKLYQRTNRLQINDIFNLLKNGMIKRVISFQQSQILVNITILLYTLLYAQNILYKKYLCEKFIGQAQKFYSKYESILNDSKVAKLIKKYSKIQTPYSQYLKMKSSINQNIKKNCVIQQDLQISVDNKNYIKIKNQSNFLSPSMEVILIVVHFHNFFKKNLHLRYNNDGYENLWIIKPFEGSKGVGIEITSQIQQIRNIKQSTINNRIAQKYIENIWILDSNKVNFALNEQQKQFLKKSKIYCKKFDIRQWLLLIPPKVYIFSHFYIKICSLNYNLKKPKQVQSHLSNYSVNMDNFSKEEEERSVMNESQFQQILKMINLQNKISEIKQKINSSLKKIAIEGMNQFQIIDGSFQIVGVDIIFDENLNPWVLEVNMSPACVQRTPWLVQMCQKMGQQMLRKVLPTQLFYKCSQNFNYQWKILYQDTNSKQNIPINTNLFICGKEITRSKAEKEFQILSQIINGQQYIENIKRIQKIVRKFIEKIKLY